MIDHIHHYCSPSVFLSLIKNKELWMTSLTLSNDRAEGTWMLKHWLERFDCRKPKNRLQKRGAEIVVEMALSNHTALGTCFSEERDLLSQWRGYAQDGAGFSVSFDIEKLEYLSRDFEDGSSLQLSKIAYGYQNLEDVNAVICLLHQAFNEDASKYQEGTDGIGEIALDWSPEKRQKQREAARALFTVKNGAFREEKEWRLFLFNSPSNIANVEFRESRNLLSPFVRLPIPADAIVGVTLGPTNPTPEPTIEAALEAHGINCYVSRSNASYRPR